MLCLIYFAETPIDMLMNALALKFITELDDMMVRPLVLSHPVLKRAAPPPAVPLPCLVPRLAAPAEAPTPPRLL